MDKDQNPPAPLDTRDDQIKIEEETVDNLNASVSVQAREKKAYAKRRSTCNSDDSSVDNQHDLCQATQEEPDHIEQAAVVETTLNVEVQRVSLSAAESAVVEQTDIDSNTRIVHQVNYEKPANIFTPEALNVTHHFPDLRSCGCSPPCVFSPPELPDIKTKSPTQLLKIMTLYPSWKKDRDDGQIEDLLLVSQSDIHVPIPGEQFFRAVAHCSNVHGFLKEVPGWVEAFFKITCGILRERGSNFFEVKPSTFRDLDFEAVADNTGDEKFDETNDALVEQDSMADLLEKMSINSVTDKPISPSKNDADLTNGKPGIHVMLHNVNGCADKKNVKVMCDKFVNSDYEILAINESKLNHKHSSSTFEKNGLSILRCDRIPEYKSNVKSTGGGVAILYKPSVCLSEIDIDLPKYYGLHRCEIIATRVQSPSGKKDHLTLVTVYRPPYTDTEEVKKLIEHLKSFMPAGSAERYAIIGDVNFKDETVPGAREFFKFCEEKNMDQKVCELTRVPTPSMIDLVFVSSDSNIQKATVLDDKFIQSDHKPVCFSIPLTPNSDELSGSPSSSQSLSESNSKPVPHLDQAAHSASSINVPMKSTKSNSTSDSVESAKFCSADGPSNLVDDVAKINWNQVFEGCSSSSEKFEAFYQRLSEISAPYSHLEHPTETHTNLLIPAIIVENGKSITEDTKKAAFFGNHFSKTWHVIHSELPRSHDDNQLFNCSTIFKPAIVQDFLANLPQQKNSSFFPINYGVLRQCAKSLAEPLSLLFTELLQTTTVPDAWKKHVGTVVPDATTTIGYSIQYEKDPLCDVMNAILCDYLQKTHSHRFSFRQTKMQTDENFLEGGDENFALLEFGFQTSIWNDIFCYKVMDEAIKFGLHRTFCKWFYDLEFKRTFFIKINKFIDKDTVYHVPPSEVIGSTFKQLFKSIYINYLLLQFPSQVSSLYTSTGTIKFLSISPVAIQYCIHYVERWCRENWIPLDRCEMIVHRRGPPTFKEDYIFNGKTITVRGS